MAIRLVENERKSLMYAVGMTLSKERLLFRNQDLLVDKLVDASVEDGKSGSWCHGPREEAHEPTRGASWSTIRLLTCLKRKPSSYSWLSILIAAHDWFLALGVLVSSSCSAGTRLLVSVWRAVCRTWGS